MATISGKWYFNKTIEKPSNIGASIDVVFHSYGYDCHEFNFTTGYFIYAFYADGYDGEQEKIV